MKNISADLPRLPRVLFVFYLLLTKFHCSKLKPNLFDSTSLDGYIMIKK